MADWSFYKIVLKEMARGVGVGLKETSVFLTKGRKALAELHLAKLLRTVETVAEEEMTRDPGLLQKARRLEQDIAEMATKLGKKPPKLVVLKNSLVNLAAPTEEVVLADVRELLESSSEELRVLAGHELGHIERGDYGRVFGRALTHTSEYEADRIGVELSGKPDAMVSWLERMKMKDPVAAQGSLVYPPTQSRIDRILAMGKGQHSDKITR